MVKSSLKFPNLPSAITLDETDFKRFDEKGSAKRSTFKRSRFFMNLNQNAELNKTADKTP